MAGAGATNEKARRQHAKSSGRVTRRAGDEHVGSGRDDYGDVRDAAAGEGVQVEHRGMAHQRFGDESHGGGTGAVRERR